jgi:hypothetical protein
MIGIIACSARKASTMTAARDLYRGTLFSYARRYLESRGCEIYILSALHGLVAGDQILEPYDRKLLGRSDAWRVWVARDLQTLVHRRPEPVLCILPATYYAAVVASGISHQRLFPGLPLGRLIQTIRLGLMKRETL